jgi:hypothetical protein
MGLVKEMAEWEFPAKKYLWVANLALHHWDKAKSGVNER